MKHIRLTIEIFVRTRLIVASNDEILPDSCKQISSVPFEFFKKLRLFFADIFA